MLNVVIVEDDALVRDGVELVLRKQGHAVVGRAGSAAEGYRKIVRCKPDVALVDCELGDGSGAELARRVSVDAPAVHVILYTGRSEPEVLHEALAAGAAGVMLKAGPPSELATALERVVGGSRYIDPRVAPLVEPPSGERLLSPREREVLALLADGASLTAIAEDLGMARETAKTHVRNAMSKLGRSTRTAAVVEAIRRGELDGGR